MTASARVGLQLWSLRAQLEGHLAGALRLARSFGFEVVETAGTHGRSPLVFRDELQAHGLTPVSAHFSYGLLDRDLVGVIADAQALGVEFIVVPSIPRSAADFGAEDARAAAAKFNLWGDAIGRHGMRLAYHTHGHELSATGDDGQTPLDVLMAATRPDLVFLELDVFWAAQAGADPVALLAAHPGRWKLLHLRDLQPAAGLETAARNVAVGSGAIRWQALLDAARSAGVQYYFIEDESVAPLQNIPRSLRYLDRFGL